MLRSELSKGEEYQQWKLQNIDKRHPRQCYMMERSSHDPGVMKSVSWKCLIIKSNWQIQCNSHQNLMLFFKELDRGKKTMWVSTWNERRAHRATASLRRKAWLQVLWLWLQITLQRNRQIQQTHQTGRPAEQNKETNKGVKIRSWKQRQSIQKSGDSQTGYLPVEPWG